MTHHSRSVRLTATAALGVLGGLAAAPQLSAQSATAHAAARGTTSTRSVAPIPLVLAGATVIDVRTGRHLPGQTVVVIGSRVRAVSAAQAVRIPKGARVIDAKGMYLIPGLWDMHAHVDSHANQLYPRFVAYGVTGLREMAQRFPAGPDSLRAWQHQIMAGTRVGPRVYGPSADLTYGVSIETPEDAVRIVDSLKATGVLFLKVHDDQMRPDLYFAVAREARKIGIPFVGHIPVGVTEVQASDSGQLSVEHVEENHHCWPNWPQPLDSLTEQRCAPVAAAYVRNGTWMSPTLVGANYFPEHNVREAQRFVGMMHRKGVRLLAGTDFTDFMADVGVRAGAELLEDVVYLAGATTPLEALQAATLNPAIFLHATDSLGTIAPGKLADLVILTADPLADIRNVFRIHAVVANGRYFDRAALDSMLSHTDPGPRPEVDTTHFALTEELVTHYMALKGDLPEFWRSHRELLGDAGLRRVFVQVVPEGVNDVPGPGVEQVYTYDYVALAEQDTAVAAFFEKHNLLPQQFEPTQIAIKKALVGAALKRMLGAEYGTKLGLAVTDPASVGIKNIAMVEAHRAELKAIGIDFQL